MSTVLDELRMGSTEEGTISTLPPNVRIARVIDLETTGTTDDEHAEVIEIATVDVELHEHGGVIDVEGWHTFVRPRNADIPATARAIHHLSYDDVKDGPEFREVYGHIDEGMQEGDFLVAHNAKFEQHFLPEMTWPWIDTYKVARIVWPDAPGHTNQVLRYWLDLNVPKELADPPHRALPDCFVTAWLLRELLKHKSPAEMVRISKWPALIARINFGDKHPKGTHFMDASDDYLRWIMDLSKLNEDTKFSAKYWLKKKIAKREEIKDA